MENQKLEVQKSAQEQQLEMEKQKLEVQKSAQEQQLEMEKLKQERELEEQKLNLEREKLASQERIEREKVEVQMKKVDHEQSVSKSKCKLPMFNEEKDKFDAYISRFESVAKLRGWKSDEWSIQLSLLLSGKALDAFYGLSESDQKIYGVVKEALLRKYQLTEDEFRKQFYTTRVELGETPSQYMTRMERLFSKWVELAKVDQTYVGICSLIIREQFLRRCHADLAAYLREKKIGDMAEIAKSAQTYIDAHGGTLSDKVKEKKEKGVQGDLKRPVSKNETRSKDNRFMCTYCKRSGHTEERCWDKHGSPSGENGIRQKRCYICNSTEHLIGSCPDKKAYGSVAVEVPYEQKCSCIKPHLASACISEILREGQMEVNDDGVIEKEGKKYIVHKEVCQRPVTMCTCIKLPTSLGSVNGKTVRTLRDSGCSGIVVKST
jgi:hypothetical protein